MKTNLKLLQRGILLIVIGLLMVNCSTEQLENIEKNTVDYQKVNDLAIASVKSFTEQLGDDIKTEVGITRFINENVTEAPSGYKNFENNDNVSIENEILTISIPEAGNVYNLIEQVFLEDFYNKMSNTENDKLLPIILEAKNRLSITFMPVDSSSKILSILEASEVTVNFIYDLIEEDQNQKLGGFGSCIAKNGKRFGRGIAFGAISGAVVGGLAGSAAGGIGAIPGAVYGAAWGAVRGGLGAFLWSAVDCVATARYTSPHLDLTILDEYGIDLENPDVNLLVGTEDLDLMFNITP